MFTEPPAPSSASSSTSSSPESVPDPDISPPLTPLTGAAPSIEPSASDNDDSPTAARLEPRTYTPHAVGLGLVSARQNLSPLPPLAREAATGSPTSASHAMSLNPFESVPPQTSAGPYESPSLRPATAEEDSEHIPPPSPSLAHVEAAAANATFSPPSSAPESADEHAHNSGVNAQGLRVTIPPHHHAGNPFVHAGGTALSPPPLSASQNASQSPSESMLQSPTQVSHTSLDLGQEIPFGTASDNALNLDFTEFNNDEGLSALEKIYLLSRSPAGFQRVYIAHALPGFLRSRFSHREQPMASQLAEFPATVSDEITPEEAVEYVLPLLNGLAMDDGECYVHVLLGGNLSSC